jgi:DNA-binding beta-propeller fold protein YncE
MRRDLLGPLLAIAVQSAACWGNPGGAATGGSSGESAGASGRNVDAGGPRGFGGFTGGSSTGGTTDGGVGGPGGAGPPGPFDMLTPSQGSSTELLPAELQWALSRRADSYVVEVATSSTFGSTDVVDQTVDGSTTDLVVPASALQPGVVYYWRVTASNSFGSTMALESPSWFSSPYLIAGAHGIGVTPDGTRLVVASDIEGGPVDVVNLSTHQIAPISTGNDAEPTGVAISPDGTQALVTLVVDYYAAQGTNGLAVVDLTSNTLARVITDPCASTTLNDVAYFPDGTRAALPDRSADCTSALGLNIVSPSAGSLSFIDLQVNAPYGIAIDPSGSFALMTSQAGNGLFRVTFPDTVSAMPVSTYSGEGSGGVAITPDGTMAVVAEVTADVVTLSDGSIARIALMNNGALFNDTPNTDFHNVAISATRSEAVVVGFHSVQVISLASKSVIASFPASGTSVAVSPDGATAFVSDMTNGLVLVIPLP